MEPLRITLQLGNRVVSNLPVHLDALLAYAYEKVNFDDEDAIEAGTAYHDQLYKQLPIERYQDEKDWFYKASIFLPVGEQSHSSEFYTQRADEGALCQNIADGKVTFGRKQLNDLKPHEGTIDVARGPHRNMLGFYRTTTVDAVEAYCIGDQEEIAELLHSGFITHFGSRRRAGYGEISNIEIVVDETAEKHVFNRNRHIQLAADDIPVDRPIRAPYWDGKQSRLCYVPATLL